jgi:hypothetical protein
MRALKLLLRNHPLVRRSCPFRAVASRGYYSFGAWRRRLAALPRTSFKRDISGTRQVGCRQRGIMSIAGHVSRPILSGYSHVRMEAKRRPLDEIAARQRAADESRNAEAERMGRVLGPPFKQRWCNKSPIGEAPFSARSVDCIAIPLRKSNQTLGLHRSVGMPAG